MKLKIIISDATVGELPCLHGAGVPCDGLAWPDDWAPLRVPPQVGNLSIQLFELRKEHKINLKIKQKLVSLNNKSIEYAVMVCLFRTFLLRGYEYTGTKDTANYKLYILILCS